MGLRLLFEEGVKINQNNYLKISKKQLVPWINTAFKGAGILQDGVAKCKSVAKKYGRKNECKFNVTKKIFGYLILKGKNFQWYNCKFYFLMTYSVKKIVA